jgi:hypothetical protein
MYKENKMAFIKICKEIHALYTNTITCLVENGPSTATGKSCFKKQIAYWLHFTLHYTKNYLTKSLFFVEDQ